VRALVNLIWRKGGPPGLDRRDLRELRRCQWEAIIGYSTAVQGMIPASANFIGYPTIEL